MRCYVIQYRRGNKATFECERGHIFRQQLLECNYSLRDQELLTRLANGWRRPRGSLRDCPRCEPVGWRSAWWRS